ncbi:hypothetical protein [Streptomyces sasae]|uniref:hypothetical protein n=1 Tax=Streptomyces sasae TaxID=1266772 RepID=UPI00292D43C0|nr:hypothetical protein [Streptomyces sasae]
MTSLKGEDAGAVDSTVKTLLTDIVRGLLPAPDPVRRRRVRASARKLVDCDPWAEGDDARTGPDVAKLALLRLLHLQLQTRRAAMAGVDEAVVQLARSSVEVCVLGVCSLHETNVVAQLRAGYLKAINSMLTYLVDEGLVTKDLLDQSAAAMGRAANGPSVWAMADRIDTAVGSTGAVSLYRRFYVPTSAFFVHANAASLLRHVRKDNTLSERPSMPWTRRSALHVSDACVGLLASAIAASEGKPFVEFESYAYNHMALTFTPMAVAMTQGLRRSMQLSQLPLLVRTVRDLRQYTQSPQAAADTPEAREARLRDGYDEFVRLAGLDLPDDVVRLLGDDFVSRVLEGIAEYAGETAQADSSGI